MDKHLVSFTATLFGYLAGQISLEDVAESWLHFGCARQHVLGNPSLLPRELAWRNRVKVRFPKREATELPEGDIDRELREAFRPLREALEQADTEGRISWQVSSEGERIRRLPPDDRVFWHDTWQTARDHARPGQE